MTVVVHGNNPEVDAIIDRRRRLGQDTRDELWEGVYHMAPYAQSSHGRLEVELAVILAPLARAVGLVATGPFNLGVKDDYRIPDLAVREPHDAVYLPTARVVVEILSPDDDTYVKFPFYAEHNVDEIVVVDPVDRTVRLWALRDGVYHGTPRSRVLDVDGDRLAGAIDWPPEPVSPG